RAAEGAAVRVLGQRIEEAQGAGTTRIGRLDEVVRALAARPAVVPAGLDHVDLFVTNGSDVADPELVGRAIDRKAERIAQPASERGVLPAAVFPRVAIGDRVRPAVLLMVDVDAVDLAEEAIRILAVQEVVLDAAAVAEGDVEQPVLAEMEIAGLVPRRD